MGAGRIIAGIVFCLTAAILVIFFVTLGYTAGDYPQLGSIELYQLIFSLMMHPYYCMTFGLWSALAALAVGALIGGLIAKSVGGGMAVGFLTWIINLILYMAIVWAFDFTAMTAYWASLGGNLYLDIAISLSILIGIGALGGRITASTK